MDGTTWTLIKRYTRGILCRQSKPPRNVIPMYNMVSTVMRRSPTCTTPGVTKTNRPLRGIRLIFNGLDKASKDSATQSMIVEHLLRSFFNCCLFHMLGCEIDHRWRVEGDDLPISLTWFGLSGPEPCRSRKKEAICGRILVCCYSPVSTPGTFQLPQSFCRFEYLNHLIWCSELPFDWTSKVSGANWRDCTVLLAHVAKRP